MLTYLYLFLAGLAGGFIAGLAGIGGGTVYVLIIPITLTYLGVPIEYMAQYTIANSMFAIFFASLSANYSLFKNKNIYPKQVFLIGIPAVIISLFALHYFVNTKYYSLSAFNLTLIVLMIYMLIRTIVNAQQNNDRSLDELNPVYLVVTGSFAGLLSALSGLGGGVLTVPILNSWMKVNIKKAASISLGVIVLSSFAMTVVNLLENPGFGTPDSQGYIIFPIAIALSLGVVIASPLGVKMSVKLSSKIISYIYAAFLGIVIIKKIMEVYSINS
jgi:uncharacterized protein